MSKIVAVTGHRPEKLGGYTEEAFKALTEFAEDWLRRTKPAKIITGMALGWDQAVAMACVNAKVPFIAAVPCDGQESQWPVKSQEFYVWLLSKAEKTVYVSDKPYFDGCMQLRNKWMVDNSDALLALFNGSAGGTKNCFDYATNCKKIVINLWDSWALRTNAVIEVPEPIGQQEFILNSVSQLPNLSNYGQLIFDCEASGFSRHQGARMAGFVIGPLFENIAWYIPLRAPDGSIPVDNVRRWLRELLRDPRRLWVGHNIKYDLGMLRADEMEVDGPIFDTMLAWHNVNGDKWAYGLDAATKEFVPGFRHKCYERVRDHIQQTQGIDIATKQKGAKKRYANYSLVPSSILGPYACEDNHATRLVFNALNKQPLISAPDNFGKQAWSQKQLLFNDMKLSKTLFRMEDRGTLINRKETVRLNEKAEGEINWYERIMDRCAGYSHEWGSWAQRRDAFKAAGGEIKYWTLKKELRGKQKTQQFTTDKEKSTGRPNWNAQAVINYIKELTEAKNTRALEYIKSFREAASRKYLKSTYLDAFLRLTDRNGVLHGAFNQHTVITGRLSSDNPNCFSADTEILTRRGWVLFPDLKKEDECAQFDENKNTIDFAQPRKLISKKFVGKMLHLKSDKQIDLLVTPDHRCLTWDRKKNKWVRHTAVDYPRDNMQWGAAQYVGGDVHLSAEQVRLVAAFQADGSKVATSVDRFGINFRFKKERKIARMIEAMAALRIEYTFKRTSDGYAHFYIGCHEVEKLAWLKDKKQFGSWILELDRKTLDLLSEEVWHWDGCFSRRTMFASELKNNADWVQILTVLSGRRARVRNQARSKLNENWKDCWNVDASNRSSTCTSRVDKIEVDYNDVVYCVSMPNDTVIVRRNGKVSITCQCQNLAKQKGTADQKALESFLKETIEDEDELEAFEEAVKGALNRQIRSLFVARPGNVLVSCDFSQIEYRWAAWLSQDTNMIEQWINNPSIDYHDATVALMGVGRDEAKILNFGILYGMGPRGLAATLTGMGKPTTIEQAKDLINRLLQARPALKNLLAQIAEFAKRHGYIQNCFGRVCPIQKGFEYKALNYLDQGSAGDQMRWALVQLQERIDKEDWPVWLQLTVHDEIVAEMPIDAVEEYAPKMAAVMCDCPFIGVPLTSDIEVGSHWNESIPLKKWLEARKAGKWQPWWYTGKVA